MAWRIHDNKVSLGGPESWAKVIMTREDERMVIRTFHAWRLAKLVNICACSKYTEKKSSRVERLNVVTFEWSQSHNKGYFSHIESNIISLIFFSFYKRNWYILQWSLTSFLVTKFWHIVLLSNILVTCCN